MVSIAIVTVWDASHDILYARQNIGPTAWLEHWILQMMYYALIRNHATYNMAPDSKPDDSLPMHAHHAGKNRVLRITHATSVTDMRGILTVNHSIHGCAVNVGINTEHDTVLISRCNNNYSGIS